MAKTGLFYAPKTITFRSRWPILRLQLGLLGLTLFSLGCPGTPTNQTNAELNGRVDRFDENGQNGPASGVLIRLFAYSDTEWQQLANSSHTHETFAQDPIASTTTDIFGQFSLTYEQTLGYYAIAASSSGYLLVTRSGDFRTEKGQEPIFITLAPEPSAVEATMPGPSDDPIRVPVQRISANPITRISSAVTSELVISAGSLSKNVGASGQQPVAPGEQINIVAGMQDWTSPASELSIPTTAVDASGNSIDIYTTAMILVEMNTRTGDTVNVTPGENVPWIIEVSDVAEGDRMSFLLQEKSSDGVLRSSNQPGMIGMYRGNDTLGSWQEELVQKSQTYDATEDVMRIVTQIPHFSHWNHDDPCIGDGGDCHNPGDPDMCCGGLQCRLDTQTCDACLDLGQACTAADDCCGNASCGFANTGGNCCLDAGTDGCTDDADCCAVFTCQSGTCCAPSPGSPCDNDADCCSGLVCSDTSNTCTFCSNPGNTCSDDADCCGDATCNTSTGLCVVDDGSSCSADDECQNGDCTNGTCGSCSAVQGSCIVDADCCGTLNCNSGACCGLSGESCASNTDCCGTNACVGGVCAGCQDTGGNCSSDADCCSGNSCLGGTCCAGQNDTCGIDADCCGALSCESGACCSPPSETCTNSSECCGNGTCESGACCYDTGESCSDSTECCGSDVCSGGACCVSLGGACTTTNDCCSIGICTGGFCAAICLPEGEPCSTDGDCCGTCVDNFCLD